MNIKEAIKTILLALGEVSVPYKTRHKDHFSSLKLFHSVIRPGHFILCIDGYYEYFKSIDGAVDDYVSLGWSKKNLGLAYKQIQNGLENPHDFDNFSEAEIKKKCEEYFKEDFYKDFPWVTKSTYTEK